MSSHHDHSTQTSSAADSATWVALQASSQKGRHNEHEKRIDDDDDQSSSSKTKSDENDKENECDYIPLWYFNFGLAGSGFGFFLAGIMYLSLEYSLVRYGGFPTLLQRHQQQQGEDLDLDGTLELKVASFQYLALWLATHIGEVAYVMVCAVLACLLTRRGSQRMVNIFQSTLDSGGMEDWSARSVFRCVVLFEGGLLFGSSCMVIAVETLVGTGPISVLSFAIAVAVNVIVGVILVKCYDYHFLSNGGDSRYGKLQDTQTSGCDVYSDEAEDATNPDSDDQIFGYAAIV